MKKSLMILLIIFLIVIIAGLLLIFFKPKANVYLKDVCFEVEIANNFASREVGLMYRKNLDQNKGMLFVFPTENIYPFWMKNTLIPLDIIWVNENKEIVFINENTQPCKKDCPSINPKTKAKYVLELNAGKAREIGLSLGDKIEIKYENSYLRKR